MDAQEPELLCLLCQDGMLCISFAPDAWNLSGRCQETQEAQDAGDATQDAQDAWDADSTSCASGHNGAVSDAG